MCVKHDILYINDIHNVLKYVDEKYDNVIIMMMMMIKIIKMSVIMMYIKTHVINQTKVNCYCYLHYSYQTLQTTTTIYNYYDNTTQLNCM
jgi:hypothetical protein